MSSVPNTTFSSLVEARYRDGQSIQRPLPNDFPPTLQTILNHASCRSFLPTPLPTGTLEALMAAAQSGSTSSMLQTWDVIAIQDPSHKSAVATLAGDQEFIRQAPLFLVFCANLHRLANISRRYDQPGRALANTDMFLMASLDAAIAGQNTAIAAESLGLKICYVGAVRNNAQQMCELLGLPHNVVGVFGMAVGYGEEEPTGGIKPRLPMREVCHREVWSEEDQEENIQVFDEALGAFYAGVMKLGRDGWSKFVAGNMASVEQDGRENLKETLYKQGFKLN
ncbi:Nitro/flavin reductase [Aspergillus steynii IBT 23096]|uniref:Nitro/flavin reductase n=1 Tax=Aspergillus steynii IBT 23096 TaxID=1392250 RepID=A0A2I2GD78_9EURO|nr:Nitro/flavin reductase [Aspergillus steynii IBT 23096]PLB50822.1 Nitro/flavin reductase [Aspergillus steynii IBT 23096]